MPFNLWWIFFAFCPFFFFSPFFLPASSLLPHTQILCPESCNCTSYCSQKIPCSLLPIHPFHHANTGHVCARAPVQSIVHFLCGLFAQICSSHWDHSGSYLQQANNYHITPQHYSSMLNDLSSVAAKSYSSQARLILCKPFNWILLRREPMSYPCTCSSTRHITHPSV